MREHAQVRPLHGRMQEGAGRAHAPAVQDGALGEGDAFLDLSVVIGIAGDTGLDCTLDEGVAQGVAPVDVGDGETAVAAAEGGIAVADALFHAAEIGEHIGVAPAAVAELRPGVEVHGLAAIIDVAVDGAGAAERLAAWGEDAPPARPRARLHAVEPVHALVVVGLDEAGGDVDVGVPVARTRLQHAHAGRAVRRQPVGEHAASRARRPRSRSHRSPSRSPTFSRLHCSPSAGGLLVQPHVVETPVVIEAVVVQDEVLDVRLPA